jgi:hypothetical protein
MRPDEFALARLILTRQRRLGEPFSVAWARMLGALPEAEKTSNAALDHNAALAVLERTREEWERAYEGRPAPPPPYPQAPIGQRERASREAASPIPH